MKFIAQLNKPVRTVVALVGVNGLGLYTRHNGVVYFMGNNGEMRRSAEQNWDLLCRDPGRSKIYAGDSLTVEF